MRDTYIPQMGIRAATPEFNDCQRLRVPKVQVGAGFWSRYVDTWAGVLANGAFVNAPPSDETKAYPYVTIYASGPYPQLNLGIDSTRPNLHCLYLYKNAGKLAAAILPQACDEKITVESLKQALASLKDAQELEVKLDIDSQLTRLDDYPPVARWDWDPHRNEQYVGFKCGAAWCEVGRKGFTSSPSLLSRVTNARDIQDKNPELAKVLRIKGWYDEQLLADPNAKGVEPDRVMGSVIPVVGGNHDLDYYEAHLGKWVPVAYVALRRLWLAGNGYLEKRGFIETPKEFALRYSEGIAGITLNEVSLCLTRTPQGKAVACEGADQMTCPGDGSDGWWRAQVTGEGQKPRFFCVTYNPAPKGEEPPATARWRWVASALAGDEMIWDPCGAGCCEW